MDQKTLRDALRAAGFSLFDREPYGAKNCAQANLSGRTHFADDAREDSERYNAMVLAELDVETKTEELEKAFILRHRSKFGGFDRVRDAIEELRQARQELRDATAAYERG